LKMVVARAGNPEVEEVPIPVCRDNEVMVRTSFSVISTGTETWTIGATEPITASNLVGDRAKLRKAFGLVGNVFRNEGIAGVLDYAKDVRNPRVPLGYSLAGVVVEVGRDIGDIVPGDLVACGGEGKAAHAEFAAVPRNLVAKVPDGVQLSDAAFGTLGAIAVQGFRRSDARVGEAVLVVGVGLVGSLTVQVAKAAGCRVAAVDLREDRANFALQLGADRAFRMDDPKLTEHVSAFTGGRGFDHVIVCASTGSSDPINLASALMRDRGRVTIVGRVGMDIERKDYYQKELDLVMSRSLGPGRYDPIYEEAGVDYPVGYVRWTLNRNIEAFLDLVKDRKIDTSKLVGGRYDISQAPAAYESLKTEGSVAVLLTYTQTPATAEGKGVVLSERNVAGVVGAAVVGPGNYAKEILIPNLRGSSDYSLRWLVSSNPLHARQIGERYRFEKCGTSLSEALADDSVRVVFIATPNNQHLEMVGLAAAAGKIVFVEKPLCITPEELDEAVRIQERTGARIVVGFNRRYAPLVKQLKKELGSTDGPFLMNYRVNADYIPSIRWVQDPKVGGGRIVAECCHFFDLFSFLLGESGPTLDVTCAGINGASTVARDNLVAVAKYKSGSVATLTYSALGNRGLDRERIEVFGAKNAFVLDDFKTLRIYEPNRIRSFGNGRADKGHRAELSELAKAVRGESTSVISFQDAVASMATTFEAERDARASSTAGGD